MLNTAVLPSLLVVDGVIIAVAFSLGRSCRVDRLDLRGANPQLSRALIRLCTFFGMLVEHQTHEIVYNHVILVLYVCRHCEF